MPYPIILEETNRLSELSTLNAEFENRKNHLANTYGRGERKFISKQLLQIKRDIRRNLKQGGAIG